MLGLSSNGDAPEAGQETLVSLTPVKEEPPSPVPTASPSPEPTVRQADKAEAQPMEGEASPPNLRNRASPVFGPLLPPISLPPPIVAAPRPATGNAGNTGASDRVGPGQGAGGTGNGRGGGGAGAGGRGSGEAVTRPVQIKGHLRWSDLPEELRKAKRGGELELTYRVNIDGRVSDCRVTKSSGLPDLDARTCELITERFRFRPSRNAGGEPVPSYIVEIHGWYNHPEGEPDWAEEE
ncbi:energy transducer TonB [Novosphingobium sp. M1R2S20]|uniref:Energy transducer TonB n=1 Tax=Novosphingobium rhizovicinum TaxID=3228928 RepID=A0ABV3RFJ6_9SPHN